MTKLKILFILLLLMISITGCTSNAAVNLIQNYPKLLLHDTEFCCEFRSALMDESGNFVLSPVQYIELYVDWDKNLLTVLDYNNNIIKQYDYRVVVFDYYMIMNNSNEIVIVRTGLLTDLSDINNKIIFKYAFHENSSYMVFELNTVNGIQQFLFLNNKNLGNM